jgi:hypothetical protein
MNHILLTILLFSIFSTAYCDDIKSIIVSQNAQVNLKSAAFRDWEKADTGIILMLRPNQDDLIIASKGEPKELNARSFAPLQTTVPRIYIISFSEKKFISSVGITTDGKLANLTNDMTLELDGKIYTIYFEISVDDLTKVLLDGNKFVSAVPKLIEIKE